jgi:hypothetical protein
MSFTLGDGTKSVSPGTPVGMALLAALACAPVAALAQPVPAKHPVVAQVDTKPVPVLRPSAAPTSKKTSPACDLALAKISDGKQISAIAYECGFTNLSSFYRQFTARHGFSPSEARSAARGETTKPAAESTFAD